MTDTQEKDTLRWYGHHEYVEDGSPGCGRCELPTTSVVHAVPEMPNGLAELGSLAHAALTAAERDFPRIMADLAASLPYVPVRRNDDV